MFYVTYMLSELRRRSGRTVLTALGLAVGIGVVVTVSALSTGLDRAQAKVLAPLTGVGTDLSVTRPLKISSQGGFGGLSDKERQQLEQENGGARIGLQNLGKPGTHFSRYNFVSTAQLSFPQSQVAKERKLDGVKSAAGALTLTSLHIEGTVPEQTSMWRDVSVSAPAADFTPSSLRTFATWDCGKLSCAVETKLSREKCVPGLPRFCSPIRAPPFSCSSCCRSLSESPPKPPWLEILSGRVTDRSVPTPVSGASTFACARSSPVERALTVTTTPMPTASPSAVSTVRPLLRRSSLSMYVT